MLGVVPKLKIKLKDALSFIHCLDNTEEVGSLQDRWIPLYPQKCEPKDR